jgi:hypothetical protein
MWVNFMSAEMINGLEESEDFEEEVDPEELLSEFATD